MNPAKKQFVLIHGAWHNAQALSGCATYLRQHGHRVHVPTMPGHHPHDPSRRTITLDDYIDAVEQAVIRAAHHNGKVTLVGHSSAGFLLQAAAPRVADKLDRLVFHNAWILGNGQCQFDLVPPDIAGQLEGAAAAAGDNCVPVLEAVVRHLLMPMATTEEQDALLRLLVPQPLALFTTPVDTTAFARLDLPKSVVSCMDDASGPYMMLAGNLGTYDLLEIPGGHETIFTAPERVGEALLAVCGVPVSDLVAG